MSDNQTMRDEYTKAHTKLLTGIFGVMALKWIIIYGLNRWARSVK
jgi:hypothetical protein